MFECAEFGRTVSTNELNSSKEKKCIELGNIYHMYREESLSVNLDVNSLSCDFPSIVYEHEPYSINPIFNDQADNNYEIYPNEEFNLYVARSECGDCQKVNKNLLYIIIISS